MTEITFKPRVAPRDVPDSLLSVAIATFQAIVFIFFPALICYWLTQSEPLAISTGIGTYLLFCLFGVANLVVSSTGIRFSRLFGGPKFIPWSAIASVQEAPRRELILRGWLWPLFPAREMTPSFTSLGHYRIQFGRKSVYFPPANPEAFMAAIRAHLVSAPNNSFKPKPLRGSHNSGVRRPQPLWFT